MVFTLHNVAKVNYSQRYGCYYTRTEQGLIVRFDTSFCPDPLGIFSIPDGKTIDISGILIYSDQGFVTMFIR